MVKGIKIATTDISKATKDEKVIDSTVPGSWKIAKPIILTLSLTYSSGPAVTGTTYQDHKLGYTSAYIAGVFISSENKLYNIPFFQDNFASLKVYVDNQRVYASGVSVFSGTNTFTFHILLLGEKIE